MPNVKKKITVIHTTTNPLRLCLSFLTRLLEAGEQAVDSGAEQAQVILVTTECDLWWDVVQLKQQKKKGPIFGK